MPKWVKQRKLRNALPTTWIILDSGSTVSIFSNKALLHDIYEAPAPLVVRCNAGTVKLTHRGYFGTYPTPVWYNPKGVANILSKYEVGRQFKMVYDNSKWDGYTVQVGDQQVHFGASTAGLYYRDVATDPQQAWIHIQTVKQQKSQFTKKEVRRAARARRIQNIIGRPGVR